MTQSIPWRSDLDAALRDADAQRRLVIVHFRLDGRPVCEEMEKETLSHPAVVKASTERFLNVKVDIAAHPDLFAAKVGGRGGLATCVIDATGDVVSSHPGFAKPEEYLQLLDRAEKGFPRLKAARESSNRAPEDPSLAYDLAEVYLSLGSPRRAEENCNRALALAAARNDTRISAFCHERLARARAYRGQIVEAQKHVAQYRKVDPDNRFGRLDRVMITEAVLMLADFRYADAIRRIEEASRRFPSCEEADQMLYVTGVARHESRQDKPAMADFEALLRLHPGSRWATLSRERIEHIKNPPPGHVH